MARIPRRKYGTYGRIGPARGFTWNEVACKDAARTLPGDRYMRRRFRRQARALNRLRRKIRDDMTVRGKKPPKVSIHITSWYRTPDYNAKIGGARFSMHVAGKATDITITVNGERLTPDQVARYAAHIPLFAKGGIGVYDPKHGNFTHVDHRSDGPARWRNG